MDTDQITLPPGAVTGIGSLPFCDPHTAVRFVAQVCPTIPFWPELPQRSPDERSVEQTLGPFADLLRPRAAGYGYDVAPEQRATLLERLEQHPVSLDPTRSAGFFAFEQALKTDVLVHAVAVKGQIIGPLTLAWQIFIDDVPLVRQPVFCAAIGRYIARLARWQIDRLAQWGKPVLLFLDEPCLALMPASGIPTDTEGLITVLRTTLATLRQPGVLIGVHTCATLPQGDVPVAALCQTWPDIISFDAHYGLEAFCAAPIAQAFLRAGGRVAFGLIPTWRTLDHLNPNELFLRWLVAVTGVMPLVELARQTLITATCGLGLLTEPSAHASFHLSHHLAQRIAQVVAEYG